MTYLYFTSSTCAPCKSVRPHLTKLGGYVQTIDVDRSPTLVGTYSVRSVPTLIQISGDREVQRIVGAPSILNYLSSK